MAREDLFDLTREVVADGVLDEHDVGRIVEMARLCCQDEPLTVKDREQIMDIVHDRMRALSFSQLPLALRILAIILIATGSLGIASGIMTVLSTVNVGMVADTLKELTATTITLIVISAAASFASSVLSLLVGVLLLRGRRGAASVLINVNIALTVVSAVCQLMLYGIAPILIFNFIQVLAQAAFSAYLNPSLANESVLRSRLRQLDDESHARIGTLGLADPGEGYIRLDFFNLFWIFIVASVLGLIIEDIWHMTVYDPGVFQDRAGLLWGPFSPIYGIGAVLMTVALNRFKDRNVILIFLVCTIIGGGFEYFVSWFMEVAFGASGWDYSDQFLGDVFGGRTCLLFASLFGLLGTAWIKLLLPLLLRLINLIPLRWRFSVTTVCTVLMLVNGAMTLQALDNWGARAAGHVPNAGIEQFYARNFDDDYMAARFQSMALDPEKSVRA